MAKRIGIDWVNEYHGRADDLKDCQDQAEGFYKRLSGVKVFNWGDDNAWDTDFEQQGVGSPAAGGDTLYADNVDIVYFAGHGNSGHIAFGVAAHDDGSARNSEMALGNKSLRYLVLDSCLSMQSGSTSAINRWKGIFKGLRIMFGFRSNANDETDRGEVFADYLNDGHSMISSWRWACEETAGGDYEWGLIHVLSPSSAYGDTWQGASPAISSPTSFCYHSGGC